MEITLPYIISQILAIIALILMVLAYQRKDKSKILGFTITSNALYGMHYLLLGAWSGVATKIITITRDSYIVHKGKKAKKLIPLLIFICAYTVMAIITFKSPLSILPLCASVFYSIAVYYGNEQRMRIVAIITCLFWLVYNISVFSVAGIMSDAFIITSNVVAYLRYKKFQKHKKSSKKQKTGR